MLPSYTRSILFLIIIASLVLTAGCMDTEVTPSADPGFIPVTVTRVVDGDTIIVNLDGQEERVRLIGVDTPETVHPNKEVEEYGPEASAYTKDRLTGAEVYLEFDVETRDRYGRLLAYVWLSRPEAITDAQIREHQFNAHLLLDGYAQMATFPPNVKYVDYYQTYQEEARAAQRGLWASP